MESLTVMNASTKDTMSPSMVRHPLLLTWKICNGVSLGHYLRRFLRWWWLFFLFMSGSEGRYSHNYGSGGQGYGGGYSDNLYGGSRRGGEYR